MAEGLKKEYYSLDEEEFNELLKTVRSNPETKFWFRDSPHPYFFLLDETVSSLIVSAHENYWRFDDVFRRFSAFGRKQIILLLLINEIEATNSIENIQSTRHDIFYVLTQNTKRNDAKLASVSNAYETLLNNELTFPVSVTGVRDIYDRLMKGVLRKDKEPDGLYFRKGPVYITDGTKSVLQGFWPEENIINAVGEFLKLCHEDETDIFLRMILSHFLIETIHPFYDGNGRLGRFLAVMGLYQNTGSYGALLFSAALKHQKSRYYHSLKEARDPHMFGCLNTFVEDILKMMNEETVSFIQETEHKQRIINKAASVYDGYTKSEKKILGLINEASVLSEYGISNAEIMEYGSVSKRTVISAMQRFRKDDLIEESQVGRTVYHKLTSDQLKRLENE